MSVTHTPGPWRQDLYNVQGSTGNVIAGTFRQADAILMSAAPDLLALAHRYAEECGECAGTRVMPDDEPCEECAFIWSVIDKAEGRA